MTWSESGHQLTNSGVIREEDGEKGELPDESDDGGNNPNDQGKSNLLHTAQDEKNIDQSVP